MASASNTNGALFSVEEGGEKEKEKEREEGWSLERFVVAKLAFCLHSKCKDAKKTYKSLRE